MSEKITICDLEKPGTFFPMDREEFYEEQVKVFKETGKPSKASQIIDILLFTEEKEIILQKRALNKLNNPNLIDKSIGGHNTFGDTPFYTVMVETIQELKVPSIVLKNDEDFRKTHLLLKNYIGSIAVIKEIDNKIFELEKIMHGERIKIANDVHLFFGVYGGAIKPVDKEATGVLYYDLDVLSAEIKQNPDFFTGDLKFFLEHYRKEIDEFLKSL